MGSTWILIYKRDMLPKYAPAQDDGLAMANAIRAVVENRLGAIVSDRVTCWQMVGNFSTKQLGLGLQHEAFQHSGAWVVFQVDVDLIQADNLILSS